MSITDADNKRQWTADQISNRSKAIELIKDVLPKLKEAELILDKVYELIDEGSLEHEIRQYGDGLLPSLEQYIKD